MASGAGAIYDIFILSLDQLLSGGLMNSRCMSENQDLILDDGSAMTEYAVIDYLCELSQTKQLYLIDSVMRLASSCDYGGFQLEHYSIFRAYGNVARPVLKDDALTIENIIANYKYYEDGTTPAYHRAGLSRDPGENVAFALKLRHWGHGSRCCRSLPAPGGAGVVGIRLRTDLGAGNLQS